MKKSIRNLPALLLAGILSAAASPASGADDPFVRGQGEQAAEPPYVPKFVSVCFETFSLELAEAVTLYHGQPNDTALYKELATRVSKGKAKKENFAVLSARSGEKATLKGTSEIIYPQSYLPEAKPEEEQQPPARGAAPKPAPPAAAPVPEVPATPPVSALPFPTNFTTRDVGFKLEIEPMIGGNERIIDLWLAPEFVTLADRTKWGPAEAEIETPVFEVQQLSTAATVLSDQIYFVGTLSRPPVSKADADSADRVWFAFVKAKVVSVTEER